MRSKWRPTSTPSPRDMGGEAEIIEAPNGALIYDKELILYFLRDVGNSDLHKDRTTLQVNRRNHAR